ncbi:hypothetical protein Pcinc_024191 [Petrolisthes cinctipes]|uniref:Uncharacterized protein n=1 Tax=Petrolisthes cinctipes TaxID=88211 RepID=A0AAE1KES2_PETCI|nr:hypothetical protein Pcinc_024191 [Petrolisthes cinctipes]
MTFTRIQEGGVTEPLVMAACGAFTPLVMNVVRRTSVIPLLSWTLRPNAALTTVNVSLLHPHASLLVHSYAFLFHPPVAFLSSSCLPPVSTLLPPSSTLMF